jgi:nitrate reductase gamma subunit
MVDIYQLLSGPIALFALGIFFVGSLYRIFSMMRLAKKDKVVYPYMDLKHSLRSLVHWITPFASRNMRLQPEVTVVTFAFHIGLVLMPLFLLPHNILIERAFGISWWSLPKAVADALTLIVIFSGIIFLIRRLGNPVIRFVTYPSDYLLLAIAVAPFLTGFLAYHHIFHYTTMSMLHIVSGIVFLVAIPFTRLAHMIYFAFSRAYMGCEFGAVRNSKDW